MIPKNNSYLQIVLIRPKNKSDYKKKKKSSAMASGIQLILQYSSKVEIEKTLFEIVWETDYSTSSTYRTKINLRFARLLRSRIENEIIHFVCSIIG